MFKIATEFDQEMKILIQSSKQKAPANRKTGICSALYPCSSKDNQPIACYDTRHKLTLVAI